MLRLFSLRSNLALCLVLRILFPILLNHVLFISLHVRAVELVILVKPIGISTHVLMSISFRTKFPTLLNILVLLKVVGISVISLVLRATASKYGESHDSSENSDFFLLRQKDPFGELFSEIYFQSSSEFTFL